MQNKTIGTLNDTGILLDWKTSFFKLKQFSNCIEQIEFETKTSPFINLSNNDEGTGVPILGSPNLSLFTRHKKL